MWQPHLWTRHSPILQEETHQYYNESRSIIAEGKFNLRSWASNSKALRDQAFKQNAADPNEIVNLLGLKWDPTSDTLTFNQRAITPSFLHLITKRKILRQSSKTFDPLGMLSPVTITAKLFLSESRVGRATFSGVGDKLGKHC